MTGGDRRLTEARPVKRELRYPADIIPIQYHSQMLLDDNRMDPFERAISLVVRPGMRVLELGAGTGVLSHFAARAGASVTAVEYDAGVRQAAARCLAGNPTAGTVTLVAGDAYDYLPTEPVDLVICEMLHVGLLREKQPLVIASFLKRYTNRFPGSVPRLIPAATIQAVQPVMQDFRYHGYTAPAPIFQDATAEHPRTRSLAAPEVYQAFFYADTIPQRAAHDRQVTVTEDGELNAVRIITKNLLAPDLSDDGTTDWIMSYLVLPLAQPLTVTSGDTIRLAFSYDLGNEVVALQHAVLAERL